MIYFIILRMFATKANCSKAFVQARKPLRSLRLLLVLTHSVHQLMRSFLLLVNLEMRDAPMLATLWSHLKSFFHVYQRYATIFHWWLLSSVIMFLDAPQGFEYALSRATCAFLCASSLPLEHALAHLSLSVLARSMMFRLRHSELGWSLSVLLLCNYAFITVVSFLRTVSRSLTLPRYHIMFL